jgi:paraquat-inducible protein B
MQQDLRQTLQEVERASRSLRTLADYLQRNPQALLRGKASNEAQIPDLPPTDSNGEQP